MARVPGPCVHNERDGGQLVQAGPEDDSLSGRRRARQR